MRKKDTTESLVKRQYVKIARKKDWKLYKEAADYYLKTASYVMEKNILADKKLLFRNITKRLYLGIGSELLLKSLYLKKGYHLNLPNSNSGIRSRINLRNKLKDFQLNKSEQTNFASLIDFIHNLILNDYDLIKKGLNISKVFRNKEAHSIFMWHSKGRASYDHIEMALVLVYLHGFNENLEIKISYLKGESPKFILSKKA